MKLNPTVAGVTTARIQPENQRGGAPGARTKPGKTNTEPVVSIDSIMSRRVVTVGFDDTLATAKSIFDEAKFHHLLVVEHGELHGVVSDRDLLRAISPFIGSTVESARDVNTLNKRVHQIMSRKPITLRPEAEIADAVELLLAHKISCIPIVDEQFRPVGIVSWRDILRALASQNPVAAQAAGT